VTDEQRIRAFIAQWTADAVVSWPYMDHAGVYRVLVAGRPGLVRVTAEAVTWINGQI
jgi:hypothetical protein